jgi:hypothetical protein
VSIEIRAPKVPPALLLKLEEPGDVVTVFLCLELGTDHWVGVCGDGANGWYEHFTWLRGHFRMSNDSFGSPEFAALRVLEKEVVL